MKPFYTAFILLLSSTAFSQNDTISSADYYPRWQYSTSMGANKMTRLPDGIDEQISTSASVLVNYNLHLAKKKHYLSIGIGYETSRFIADGMFIRNGSDYSFAVTPTDFKQNEIQLSYLHFPVLYKFAAFRKSAVSVGPFAGYLVDGKDKFKFGSSKQETEAHIQNKWRAGVVLDAEFILRSRSKRLAPVLGYGLQYQFTNHLKDSKSFKPFSAFIRIGFAIE
ncbi:MAG TPA: outer membrane beta-barrel protein [Chitinophagaceae bacterium]|nr:outer membrane beta-barrel protein [Chitinophagaceae bacterium]